jgi:hypothetical protein
MKILKIAFSITSPTKPSQFNVQSIFLEKAVK